MEPSQSKKSYTALGGKLSSRPVLEPLLFVALALVYLWVIQPIRNDWLRIPFLAVVILIPLASTLLRGDQLKDLGLRLDNLSASTREVGIATLIGAIAVLAIGVLAGDRRFDHQLLEHSVRYPFWGLAQQYAMQSFTYRRLREGTGRPGLAAAAAALLFASLHWPNQALALVTLVGGYVWCRLFERQPNLVTLALSHGWMAVLLYYSWPADWLHNLRIGPSFWTWAP